MTNFNPSTEYTTNTCKWEFSDSVLRFVKSMAKEFAMQKTCFDADDFYQECLLRLYYANTPDKGDSYLRTTARFAMVDIVNEQYKWLDNTTPWPYHTAFSDAVDIPLDVEDASYREYGQEADVLEQLFSILSVLSDKHRKCLLANYSIKDVDGIIMDESAFCSTYGMSHGDFISYTMVAFRSLRTTKKSKAYRYYAERRKHNSRIVPRCEGMSDEIPGKIRSLVDKGYSRRQVCKELNISSSAYERYKNADRIKRGKNKYRDLKDTFADMLRKGVSKQEVCVSLGICKTTYETWKRCTVL